MNLSQRYYMQTMAMVLKTTGNSNSTELSLSRFWAEYDGCAEEIARSSNSLATALEDMPRRVMKPLLLPNPCHKESTTKPGADKLEALIHSNDPMVLTGGAFRYTLCKQDKQEKLRNIPTGSIILFSSMNKYKCYVDTVFVVGKYVDVVKEGDWSNAIEEIKVGKMRNIDGENMATNKMAAAGSQNPRWDYSCLSREDYSHYMGSRAWDDVINNSKNLLQVDPKTKEKLQALVSECKKREDSKDYDISWPAKAIASKKTIGPRSGRLYYGKEYDDCDDNDGLFSFVPVCTVPTEYSTSTNQQFMKPRPELDLIRIFEIAGANKAPNPNAQLISKPVPIGGEIAYKVFLEIKQQIQRQKFDLGVTFAPPTATGGSING